MKTIWSRLGLAATVLVTITVLAACGGGADEGNSAAAAGTDGRAKALAAAAVPAPKFSASWAELPNPQYAPPSGPYARAWTEMTWDSLRQEMVIFAGNGPTGYENDIWSYNSSSTLWTVIDPQVFCPGNSGFSKPNGTDDTAFKYDPVNNLYWVFGAVSGYRCLTYATVRTAEAGSGPAAVVDSTLTGTASTDYREWHVRSGTTDVLVQAYNPATKTLTLAAPIAGFTAGSSFQLYATTGSGIWYFDPVSKAWVSQDAPPSRAVPTPAAAGARIAPGVAYSDADKAFVLYAGTATGTIDKRVWRLDLATKSWTALPQPAVTPPHMRELLNSMVYDKQNDVFVLFGGICSYDTTCADGTRNGDTWTYKLSTNTWTKMSPATSPTPRAQQVMAYDADNGVTVLFGGAANEGIVGDTWVYHYPSNTWTQLNPSTSPFPRYLGQIAYDPVQKRTVIFGGQSSAGMRADIWALKLTPSTANTPPAVALTSPAGGSKYTPPASITLMATASDSDGSVARVDFYANGSKIGQSTSAPFSYAWTGVAAGSYSLTAVAIDDQGAQTTSAAVTVTVADNQAPTVSLTAPTSGSAYTAPASITLAASAADADGSIAKVEFYAGATKLGQSTTAPYTYSWSGVVAGSYTLTAVATDDRGTSTTSSPVTVVVGNANQAPTVTLVSPASGSSYTAPATVTLSATASDPDGAVAKVAFYADGTFLGQATSAPYTLTWSSVAAGTYNVSAVVTDNLGATATSAVATITVGTGGAAVNVALASGGAVASASSTYSSAYPVSAVNDGDRSAAQWGNGGSGSGWNDANAAAYPDWVQITFAGSKTINRIDVFTLADTFSTVSTAATTFSLYGITAFDVQYWNGSSWATVPGGSVDGNNKVWRTFSFTPITTDRIRLQVRNSLANYSRVVEIEAWSGGAAPNAAPSVALTAPSGGSSYTAPATVTLSAAAADSDGSIAKVEFFANGSKLGEAASAPYTFNWTNVAAGSYVLTAVATDNLGATTTSATSSITVAAAPAVGTNVALASNGGAASASSTYSTAYPVAAVIDGNRRGNNWGNGGGWNDANAAYYPDWVQVTFDGSKTINRIDVFTLADDFNTTPTASTTFSAYGITAFTVQYYDGNAWVTVPGGSVTGNNLVWRSFSFPAVTTDRIRITVSGSLANYSRIVEIEAWAP